MGTKIHGGEKLRWYLHNARMAGAGQRIHLMAKPILCVDFDGVIHSYASGWKGATVIPDPPVKGALRWLWKATEWFDVQIYSSRSKDPMAREAMQAWMLVHSREEFGDDHPMSMMDG